MKWYKYLYLGEMVREKEAKIKKIEHNSLQASIYLVALPSNEENLLDIIPAEDLRQKEYPKKDLFIIGIEKGYSEAAVLAAAIVQEVYEKTKAFDVKQYILHREEAGEEG